MQFLLDTTVLIDASRHQEPARSWLQASLRQDAEIGVSAVAVAEFFAGLPPDERPRWERFVDQLTLVDVTKEIAIRAGILRYDLRRMGRTMLLPDALIAATAGLYGAALVTDNIKDFSGVGVEIVQLG